VPSPRLALVCLLILCADVQAQQLDGGDGSEPQAEFVYAPAVDPELSRDPLERFNRVSLRMNLGLGRWVVGPVARGASHVLPGAVGRGLGRALGNLALPVDLLNQLLQLRARDAGVTTGRFVVNTTVGVLGLRDPATGWGLERRGTSFGETLASYRVPAGPYLVMPLLGPTTTRDGAGELTDVVMRPETLLLGLGGAAMVVSTNAVSQHDASAEMLEQLDRSSVDLYVALRTAYLMSRQARQRSALPAPRSVAGRPGRGQHQDPLFECLDQGRVAATVDHRGVLGTPQCQLADGPVEEHVDDAPASVDGS
jgi:phospholipid-binding lipoprotein MlaA